MKMKLLGILLFVAYLLWGGFQERVKIDTNLLLDFAPQISNYHQLSPDERGLALEAIVPKVAYDYYYSHDRVTPLLELNIHQLGRFKWIFTGACAGLCLLIGMTLLYLFYRGPFFRKWVVWVFAGGAFISAAFFGLGHLLEANDTLYPVAHKFAAALQSPFAAAMLLFLERLRTFGS